ncbi:MAG: cation transporter, partial [Eubacteriales bacterium]
MAKKKFDVFGMTCSACSGHVQKSVSKLPGVREVNVNLLKNSMTVLFDENTVNTGAIVAAVQKAGYNAALQGGGEKAGATDRSGGDVMQIEAQGMKQRFITSLIFLVPLFYIAMGRMAGLPLPGFLMGMENALVYAFTQFLLLVPIIFVNFRYFSNGFKMLFRGAPNMDSLIAIGSAAAFAYGIVAIFNIGYGFGHENMALVENYSMDLYFESAGMILTLITLGKFLETRSKGKTSEAITKLMNLAPKTAVVVREGREEEIPVESVQVGDTVLVRPGQSIPVDGVLLEGS